MDLYMNFFEIDMISMLIVLLKSFNLLFLAQRKKLCCMSHQTHHVCCWRDIVTKAMC